MMYQIEEIPTGRVVYMRRVGPYGAGNYDLMEKFKNWVKANGLFTEDAFILGISHDNPQTTLPENCRYDVCIAVSDDHIMGGADVQEAELAGGRYAVFTIAHTVEAIRQAWCEVFAQLSAHGLEIDVSRPVLERYSPAMIARHLCQICVPV